MVSVNRMGGGGGGGGGSFSPGPLLSGTSGNNNDTLLRAPVEGALIVANATPLWGRLNASGIQYQLLTLTGGSGNTPDWQYINVNSFGTYSTPNLVLATLNAAGTGVPSFRSLIGADLPFTGTIKNLTDASTIAVDAALWSLGGVVRVTVAADGHTFGAPSNPHDGQKLYLEVLSSAAHTVSWDAAYDGSIVALPSSTTGGGAVDVLLFAYRSAEALWFCIGSSQSGGGSGANTALSNLASVAVNASLTPGSDNAIDLGTSALRWRSIYVTGSSVYVMAAASDANPTTKIGSGLISFGAGGASAVDTTFGRAAAGIAQLGAGNALRFQGGTSGTLTVSCDPTTTSYALVMPAAQGGASTVLTNDGSGNLTWASGGGGGGANTALSNLAAVAVNATLVLATDKAFNLGSNGTGGKRWGSVFGATLVTAQNPNRAVDEYWEGASLIGQWAGSTGGGDARGALAVFSGSGGNPRSAAVLSATAGGTTAPGFQLFYGMDANPPTSMIPALTTSSAYVGTDIAAAAAAFVSSAGLNLGTTSLPWANAILSGFLDLRATNASLKRSGTEYDRYDGTNRRLLAGSPLGMYSSIGDTNATSLLGSAVLSFGAGGGSAVDVGISRSAAGILKVTDGSSGAGTFLRVVTLGVPLTDAATIATNAALGNVFDVTITANRTLGNPTNPLDGQKFLWRIRQDGTGGFTLTADSKFRFGAEVTAIVVSAAAGSLSYVAAIYNLADDTFDVVGVPTGYV